MSMTYIQDRMFKTQLCDAQKGELLYTFNKYYERDDVKDNIWIKKIKKKEVPNIVEMASTLLSSNGFKINKSKMLIEFHCYKPDLELIKTPFTMHCDDHAGVNFAVETIIFYLKKDDSILGGNLIYMKKTGTQRRKISFGLIKYEKVFDTFVQEKLEINEGDCLMMGGDIRHVPEDVSGEGMRKSIVIQFKSLER